MGMFGLGEIIRNLQDEEERSVLVTKITGLWPTKDDFKRMVAPILRGTLIGSALGILPGSGSILGSFAAYSIEKRSRRIAPSLAKARSRALPRRSRRTMPARKRLLFHCSLWESHPTRSAR
jgi:TctA family transporter